MRLWDLRSHLCQGVLQVPAAPAAVFDQQVFSVCGGHIGSPPPPPPPCATKHTDTLPTLPLSPTCSAAMGDSPHLLTLGFMYPVAQALHRPHRRHF